MAWRRTSLLMLAAATLPAVCSAQRNTLRTKLDTLNIRVRTEHYELAGTVSDRVLEGYGQILETVYREYAAGFSELIGPPPATPSKSRHGKKAETQPGPGAPERPFRVLIFGTEVEYREFGASFLSASEHSTGTFIESVETLLIADQGNPDSTRPILFHEAFHQFMHRYIKDPPVWLNEGLATYYADAEVGPAGLRFDTLPTARWKLVRKLIEKNQALPLWDVIRAGRREFYDHSRAKLPGFGHVTRRNIYYAEAYTLIHALLADPTGRERLQNYIRDLARDDGRRTAQITQEYFGPTVCEHMTPYWIAHIQSRPENR
jgi:hypothetical protein